MSRPSPKRNPARPAPKSIGRPKWPWIALAAVAVAGIVAIALTAAGEGGDASATTVDPAEIALGADLYAANCAECHGADLDGTESGPPFLDLIYAPNHHADEAFQRAAAFGVAPHHWGFGAMPPVEGLTRDQVALIVAFVRQAQADAGIVRDPSHP